MTHGKNICEQLKAVRKHIARENDIPLKMEKCTHQGECSGSCPRCEAEVRYLENALAERLRLGKVATISGLTLALAAAVQAQPLQTYTEPDVSSSVKETMHMEDSITMKIIVVDYNTDQPVPFANVVVNKDGKMVTMGSTDANGIVSIIVAEGKYDLEVSFVGYLKYIQTALLISKNTSSVTIQLRTAPLPVIEIGIFNDNPQLEIDPYGGINTEIQGVKVSVR